MTRVLPNPSEGIAGMIWISILKWRSW